MRCLCYKRHQGGEFRESLGNHAKDASDEKWIIEILLLLMRYIQTTLLVWILAAAQVGIAQHTDSGRASRFLNTLDWEKEIPLYKIEAENGRQPIAMEKLADCYRITGDLEKAEAWYRKALTCGNQNKNCRLNYGKALQGNGKYQEAKDQFLLYEEISGDHDVAGKYIASCEMAMKSRELKNGGEQYEIRPVARLCTRFSDIISLNTRDEIIFATRSKRSEIGSVKPGKRKSKPSDYDFFQADKYPDGMISGINPLRGGINSPHDELGAVKVPGTDWIYFTRAIDPRVSKQKTIVTRQAVPEIKVLGAKKSGKKFKQVSDIPINFSDGNSNYHPAVHPAGDLVVFSSHRPGGYGGADLYMIRCSNGKWSKAENLGPNVNSSGEEIFPVFNEEGNLFFASDGNVGYGGLDLFTADYIEGVWGAAINMGSGINSSKDDFGMMWDPATSSGYFSSNRNPSRGDDIYSFRRTPGLMVQVFDGLTNDPLPGAIVRLKDINGNEKIIISDGRGQFSEPCRGNTGYLLTVDAPGFHTWRDTFWTKSIPQGRDIHLDVFLEVEQLFELRGMVHDASDGRRLGGAAIHILHDGKMQPILMAGADSADFRFRLNPGEDYTVIFKKNGYIPRILNLSLNNFRGVEVRTLNVPMTKGDYILVNGTVTEEGTAGTPIPHASILIMNDKTQQIVDSVMSLMNGAYWMAIPRISTTSYSIISVKEGYFVSSKSIDTNMGYETTVNIPMRDAVYGLDNNMKVFRYAYNQNVLDMISNTDLNEIYFFLMRNPTARLEVRSHTDSRGTSEHNLELSRRRSESVMKYIQSKKPLPDDRFVLWGFGEEFLVNECADGVECGEERHASNRRTELKVVE
jgi:OmpA family